MKIKTKNIFNNTIQEESLDKNHYLSSGGEGDVYIKNHLAYKIYQDQNKCIPEGKIKELSTISNQNVITPQGIIYNTSNKMIGYNMRYIRDNYALCQLFTKAFRTRNNLSHDQMSKLIQKLRDLIQDIHSAGIIVVDLNEMNFLCSQNFDNIFAIDTDSYQTKSYQATAIMDSIRDRHNKIFSEQTDWFSYGILSFQMFTGIHPFKGKHPTIKSIDERMQKNISVFNKDISIPSAACYPLDIIPESYKQWYKAIFDSGKRLPPPKDFNCIVLNIITDIIHGKSIEINLLQEFDDEILDVFYFDTVKAITNKGIVLNKYKTINTNTAPHWLKTPSGKILAAEIDNEKLKLTDQNNNFIQCNISAQSIMSYAGNLYIKSQDKIFVLDIIETKNIIISTKIIANVLENSSKFFDSVLIQNILGAFYVSIFPEHGLHYQIHIKELDKSRILDAKYDSGVLMCIGYSNGKYTRYIFRFDKDHKTYDVRVQDNDNTGLNFVVLDNGITICVNENDNIEIFSSRKDSANIKVIDEKIDMTLYKSGANLLMASGKKIYTAKMK